MRRVASGLFVTPIVITGPAMVALVFAQLAEIGVAATVIVEPEARDSAAAAAAAAAYVGQLDRDGIVLLLAADHYIVDHDVFLREVRRAASVAAQGWIVTFGIEPTEPATGFGYIRPGEEIALGVRRIDAFVEKPDGASAERYLKAGYLWNSGNFAFPATLMLEELQRFEPGIRSAALAALELATTVGGVMRLDPASFAGARKTSIDYAVMERTQRAAVAPGAFSWSDLGAWNSVWEASDRDDLGNVAVGDVDISQSSGVLVRTSGPFVGVIGVRDLIVVVENDAILICDRGHAQQVKALVERRNQTFASRLASAAVS